MKVNIKKINGIKSSYKYIVIIRNGLDWRLFRDFDVMCELMGLDGKILNKQFEDKSYYVAYDFTVFRVQEETSLRHRGYHL